ncbi:LuxR C-terminal-related transcriptional regulator [Maridesulfovibrio ferrireducens]|uniref:LuxR C-terminal-related transcriptional regulator n=1 Tax=Maridesulfovibrio ferrireducens TaxID=246191 RepID=UPI001A235495|nr:LuxR C-terminal-related transcriptional regulator [Maridesulfovibrio ferrireducens]MBI9109595.1 hypothetical protein [Maridesulfovibrio ferrireducens]
MDSEYQDNPDRLPEQISEVFESFSDFILFADKEGIICRANKPAQSFFEDKLIGNTLWSVFRVETDNIANFVKLYPTENVHEIPYGESGGSYSLRLISLPVPFCSDGFLAIVTNNAPLVELHETYEERLESGLEKTREQVDGMNVALRSVIESVEEEKKDMHEDFALQVREQIIPALDRMIKEPLPQMRKSFGKFIKERLEALTGKTGDQFEDLLLKLTPREIEICRYIEAGKSSEHTAELLGLSVDTILTHRKNIRRKLGLRGKKISLISYLKHQNNS